MNVAILMKLLHVGAAFWFITGLFGRNLTLMQMGRTTDIRVFQSLVQLASRFENGAVIPGSLAVLVVGVLTAWAQGWPAAGLLPAAGSGWLFVSLVLYVTLFPIVPLIFLPRGRVFEAALHEAGAAGGITSKLTAALNDRVVALAHAYEMIVVAVIVALMVTKPF